MTIAEVNSSAIGRKVSCICSGFKRTGTIVSLVEDEYTAGVHIKLDEPVFNATGYGVQHTEWYERLTASAILRTQNSSTNKLNAL